MTTSDPSSALDALLKRPLDQRLREYQYRCAQTTVFGLPVLALHFLGPHLGGGSDRWSSLMQLLLTAWIVYVAAAGMIFEGLLTLRAKFTGDFLIAVVASALFIFSAARVILDLARSAAVHGQTYFHCTVLLLALWTGAKWSWLSRSNRS